MYNPRIELLYAINHFISLTNSKRCLCIHLFDLANTVHETEQITERNETAGEIEILQIIIQMLF